MGSRLAFQQRPAKHDFTTAATDSFDDSAWRVVRVPHDWSTEEPYRPEYASGNGFAAGGIAWYRKHFKLDPAAQGRIVTVEFDGVYDNSEIWINSEFVGGRPFGYSSFAIDLTRYLNPPGADNVIAVRVDHSRLSDSPFLHRLRHLPPRPARRDRSTARRAVGRIRFPRRQ